MVELDRVTCDGFLRELPSYLDRELPDARLGRLAFHLDTCRHCLALDRFERSIIASLKRKVRAVELPAGLVDRLAAALVEARAEGRP